MINIFHSYTKMGPGKVLQNLKLGLNLCDVDYVENNFAYGINLFLSERREMYSVRDTSTTIVGPNVWPIGNEFVLNQNYKTYLVPSDWVKNKVLDKFGMKKRDRVSVWPVGIDTEEFPEVVTNTGSLTPLFDCFIYFKRRSEKELDHAKGLLNSFGQKWTVVKYGEYSEEEFQKIIKNSKYCFSLNGTESQGIATQEIMSSNLPIFVWDIDTWKDLGEEYECPASSVPYWDNSCGERVYSLFEQEEKFKQFINNLDSYSPRKFILDNLSLKKQAKELVDIVSK
ncbi:hypothetical protein CL622_01500 [archaeon]|nr:hypothetical protein [archaeon]